jgi:type II secretory pathway component PulJ
MKRTAGFTLIETLAVVVALALVMSAVFTTFATVQRQATVAAQTTEGPRRATALLDRMAHELASAALIVKPEATDPLDHPWLFFAESREDTAGADHLRFQTRSHRPRAEQRHVSDLLDVAWLISQNEEGEGFELHRWSSSQLPERLDRAFPRTDANGTQVWARGLASFGIRWLAEDGAWVDEWDSSTVLRSSQLPVAAEITVAFVAEQEEWEPIAFTRRVNLALRPLDLEAALDPSGGLPPQTEPELEDDDAFDEPGGADDAEDEGLVGLPGMP